MYNMKFKIRPQNAQDLAFVAGLELCGVETQTFGDWIKAYGLTDEHRAYIERNLVFWAL